VLVNAGESVRVIMQFNDLTDGWPYMYHCHNLLHEDNMMMAQYIVVDPSLGASVMNERDVLDVFPSPTTGSITWQAPFMAHELQLMDALGRVVLQQGGLSTNLGNVDMAALPKGSYVLVLRNGEQRSHTVVVRE